MHVTWLPAIAQVPSVLTACVAVLEESPNDLRLMAELNPNKDLTLPKPPLELARDSRDFMQTLGYAFHPPGGA